MNLFLRVTLLSTLVVVATTSESWGQPNRGPKALKQSKERSKAGQFRGKSVRGKPPWAMSRSESQRGPGSQRFNRSSFGARGPMMGISRGSSSSNRTRAMVKARIERARKLGIGRMGPVASSRGKLGPGRGMRGRQAHGVRDRSGRVRSSKSGGRRGRGVGLQRGQGPRVKGHRGHRGSFRGMGHRGSGRSSSANRGHHGRGARQHGMSQRGPQRMKQRSHHQRGGASRGQRGSNSRHSSRFSGRSMNRSKSAGRSKPGNWQRPSSSDRPSRGRGSAKDTDRKTDKSAQAEKSDRPSVKRESPSRFGSSDSARGPWGARESGSGFRGGPGMSGRGSSFWRSRMESSQRMRSRGGSDSDDKERAKSTEKDSDDDDDSKRPPRRRRRGSNDSE